MKKLIIASTCILTLASSYASTEILPVSAKVTETFTIDSGARIINIKATVKANTDKVMFPEAFAKSSAKSKAKEMIQDFTTKVCTNGEEYKVLFSENQCQTLDKKKNVVRCTVARQVVCNDYVGIKSRAGLNLILKELAPSTACIKRIQSKGFDVSDLIKENCNKIKTIQQFECVEMISSYSTLKVYGVEVCSEFNSKESIDLLRTYTGKNNGHDTRFEAPTVPLLRAIAKIKSEEEKICVENEMLLGSISSLDITDNCLISESPSEIETPKKESLSLKELWKSFIE